MAIENNLRGYPRAYVRETYLYGEVLRIARYLMCESIGEAELHAKQIPYLAEAHSKEYEVVKLLYSLDRQNNYYIIFRSGTKYVANSIPTDYTGTVKTVTATEPNGFVMKRFKAVVRLLKRSSPRLFQVAKVADLQEKVERWVSRDIDLLNSSSVVQECMTLLPLNGTGYDTVEEAIKISKKLDEQFLMCHVEGVVYQSASAVLNFFAVHPYPEELVAAINSWFDVQGFIRNLGKGEQKILFVPLLDLNFYLTHQPLNIPSFLAARGTARMLRREGSQLVQAALDAESITEFHGRLFLALAYYRGAFEVLSRFKLLEKEVPTLWQSLRFDAGELHKWWVECEEARVTIAVALREAALPTTHYNVARPAKIIGVVLHLCASRGKTDAEKAVKDLCVRLVIPKFLCELLLCVLADQGNHRLERWSNRSIVVVEKLEKSLGRSAPSGEPNYLYYSYGVAARLAERAGRVELATDLIRRQDSLRDHVRSILDAG